MGIASVKEDCCGCSACANICPRQCITLTADEEGFLYPKVDESKCIKCHLCSSVCPLLHKPAPHELLAVYGAKNKDDSVRYTSSSGGMFTLFAEDTLRRGGIALGAALDENFDVRHVFVENSGELAKLRGSKYVQSIMGTTYSRVRSYLKEGRLVLFSGTPCQVAGLKGFLAQPYENLLTVDVVCHGVPSPKVYHKFLNEIASEAGEPVTEVRFRDKEKGWKGGETLFLTAHKRFGAPKRRETYMRLFLGNVITRPSCASCAFNNKRGLSDITIADYWGVDKQFPEFDDDKGVTLVMVNTKAGKELLGRVKEGAVFINTTFEQGARFNQAVAKSLIPNSGREYLFKNLDRYTLREFEAKLLKPLRP